jgi:hypothetical protein
MTAPMTSGKERNFRRPKPPNIFDYNFFAQTSLRFRPVFHQTDTTPPVLSLSLGHQKPIETFATKPINPVTTIPLGPVTFHILFFEKFIFILFLLDLNPENPQNIM